MPLLRLGQRILVRLSRPRISYFLSQLASHQSTHLLLQHPVQPMAMSRHMRPPHSHHTRIDLLHQTQWRKHDQTSHQVGSASYVLIPHQPAITPHPTDHHHLPRSPATTTVPTVLLLILTINAIVSQKMTMHLVLPLQLVLHP